MMTMISTKHHCKTQLNSSNPPKLNVKKIALVSRNYHKDDFTKYLKEILSYLDKKGCDTVLFSLYTLDKNKSNNLKQILETTKLNNIKALFLEEFLNINHEREACDNIIYHLDKNGWNTYRYTQKFSKLEYTKKFSKECIEPFKNEVHNKRLFGNCTTLLCGESNIVKYSKKDKKIHDEYQYLEKVDDDIKVILNPIHDKMTRFEMKLKRRFLSQNKRFVISVWNKGKYQNDKNPWTVFYDGNEKEIEIQSISHGIDNEISLEIGILDI